jgi:acetyl-CoA synthetase
MTEATHAARDATATFRAARDRLLALREDYETAYRDFRWLQLREFNWALDWFDVLAAESGDRPALRIVEEDGSEQALSFAEMSARSNQVAKWLRDRGVRRGDRVIVMLGNQLELWETILAAMKLGAVIIPATPLLGAADLVDRVERGEARHVLAASDSTQKFDEVPGDYTRIAVGPEVDEWVAFDDARGAPKRRGHGVDLQLRPFRPRAAPRPDGALRRDDVLRAAHGVADADPA